MEKPPVKALILWQVLQWVSLINFHKRGFKPAPDVDAIMALTSSQMDAINTALAQQIEQNRQLKAQLASQPTEVVTEQVTVNQIAPAPQSVFSRSVQRFFLPTLQQICNKS